VTTITQEPAPPFGMLLRSFVLFCAGVYLFFTAFAMEIYVLLPISVACFLVAALPARKLLKHR
jgi:hypothetical protein